MSFFVVLLFSILPTDPWPVRTVDAVEVSIKVSRDGFVHRCKTVWWLVGGPNEIADWRFYREDHMPVGGWSLFYDNSKLIAVQAIDPEPLFTAEDAESARRKVQPAMWRRTFWPPAMQWLRFPHW